MPLNKISRPSEFRHALAAHLRLYFAAAAMLPICLLLSRIWNEALAAVPRGPAAGPWRVNRDGPNHVQRRSVKRDGQKCRASLQCFGTRSPEV